LIGAGVTVASVLMVPTVSGASCVQTESMTEPTCTVVPVVSGTSTTPTVAPTVTPVTTVVTPKGPDPVATTTSLPFTGADVEELAVVGAGAVLAGGLLLRRRKRTA
jgi:LPXTG-motif cell wall-anchored protein